MDNISNLATKLKIDEWLQKCVKYLNGTAYDVINGNTELLNFFASKTITIPPVPDYKKIMKKEKRPCLVTAASETVETNIAEKETKKDNKKETEKAYTRGFETEVSVSKYFASFGPGGIYLSDLNILELMRGYRKEKDLQPFLPDVEEVHKYLKDNSGIEIDGIFIHPKVGLAIVEVKAVEYSKETSEQQPNRLPQIIFGEEGVKKQLNNYEKFVKGLFNVIFGKEIPFPVHKLSCAPNADTGQTSVTDDIYLLDKNAFTETGESFQLFWNQMMTHETEHPNEDFIQFAAVLVTLKTAFGFVSTFNSNIISTSYDYLNEQKLAFDDAAQNQPKQRKPKQKKPRQMEPTQVKQTHMKPIQKDPPQMELAQKKLTQKNQTQMKRQNKVVYFWLNSEQLGVYEYNPGKHFISGPPGSGKTLLIKARILKFKERSTRIFCPSFLTFQYQQFILDNDLQDKAEVLSFSELLNVAKALKRGETEGMDFHKSRYGYFLSPDINIYCDEMDETTYKTENVHQIFEVRPDEAETFVVGESPDALINPIFALSEAFKNSGYSITSLKTMMRSSVEIIRYFLSLNRIAPHHNIRAGHSLTFRDIITISCNGKNEAIQKIINCINTKKDHYKYNDMAVITLKHQTDDIKNVLNNSNIPIKHIEDDADASAITILTPYQSKSYEWKMVIVWVDLEHEQALSLAVTRASIELIIIKQVLLGEQTKKQNKKTNDTAQITAEREHEEDKDRSERIPSVSDQRIKYSLDIEQDDSPPVQDSKRDELRIQPNNVNPKCSEKNYYDTVQQTIPTRTENHDVSNIHYDSDVKYEKRQDESELNEQTPIAWYRKAIKRVCSGVQLRLGICYANGTFVPQSHEEAAKWYRRAAKQGHVLAQFLIGESYFNGEGVPQSYEEAVKWLRKAADQDDAAAQCVLGGHYDNGQGVIQSYEEAIKWYKKAAEQGVAAAQSNLGEHYDNGKGVSQSYEEAVKWYRKAAEQGYADAQFNLGLSYAKGQGVQQSDEEAAKWNRKAAEQGIAQAQCILGARYAEGQGVPQSHEEAVKWYITAAEQGNANAQFNLGMSYANGQGVQQSDEEAVIWCEKAAKQGNANAQLNLGVKYDRGLGVQQSDEEAAKWYKKAAVQGDAQAQFFVLNMIANDQYVPQSEEETQIYLSQVSEKIYAEGGYHLGLRYDAGQSVQQSHEEAVKWYRKAAEQGIVQAQYNLGLRCDQGLGVQQSPAEAVKWYRKAAEKGIVQAQYNLGLRYSEGRDVPQSDEEAVNWYRKAAEKGYSSAQFNLGLKYAKGQGVPRSHEEAVKWNRKAAEQGVAQAQYNLGVSYAKGQGILQSHEEAVKWYKKAAEQGIAEAQFNLAQRYTRGQGVPQSDEEAVKWYRTAAEQGIAQAQCILGAKYDEGQGVPQSHEEAAIWYKKAAEQGYADAQFKLGVRYEEGRGVPQSDEEAAKWYKKAAEQGPAKLPFNLRVNRKKGTCTLI